MFLGVDAVADHRQILNGFYDYINEPAHEQSNEQKNQQIREEEDLISEVGRNRQC
jgi:hypothetical protein